MIRSIDYRSLAIGILIYFLGMFILELIVASLLKGIGHLIDYSVQRIVDSVELEIALSAAVTFCAGYYMNMKSRTRRFDQSVVLATVLLIFHLLGTIYALFDSNGAPLHINLIYDSTVTIAILAGGQYAKRRKNDSQPAETAV
jgi:hypothetical protein